MKRVSGSEVLFVQGIQKTGTSTLVGILNCHPEIFLLYETNLDRDGISKYGNRLLEVYPHARRFFRRSADVGAPYRDLAAYLEQRHAPYRYFGDKRISFDARETLAGAPYKTVFALRDLRTWLCKEQIVAHYRTDLDVVRTAIEYTRYLIETFAHPDCIRVRMEDLIERNADVVHQLGAFLDLDLATHAEAWWEKVGDYPEGDPKRAQDWYANHPSSRLESGRLDTQVELLPHPFWDALLPVFDRYYGLTREAGPGADERAAHLEKLEQLMEFSPLPLSDCYASILTQRLASRRSKSSEKRSRSPMRRFMKRIKKLRPGS